MNVDMILDIIYAHTLVLGFGVGDMGPWLILVELWTVRRGMVIKIREFPTVRVSVVNSMIVLRYILCNGKK